MVLKRFVIMALGALGLGALAAGPTFAQQIPAPDAYGDPLSCAEDFADDAATPGTGEVGDDGLTDAERIALEMGTRAMACADDDVGGGIQMARDLYQAAVAAKKELDDAQEAYDDDDSDRNQEKLDEASTAHMEAVDARDGYSGEAPVYEAVYAEEDRVARALAASDAYDEAEMNVDEANVTRNRVEYENYITKFAGFDATGAPLEFGTSTVKTVDDVDTTADDETAYKTFVRLKNQDGGYVAPVKKMRNGVFVDADDAPVPIMDADGNPIAEEDRAYVYEVPPTVYGEAPNGAPLTSLVVYGTDGKPAESNNGVPTTPIALQVVTIDHDLNADTPDVMWVVVTSSGVLTTGVYDPVADNGRRTDAERAVLASDATSGDPVPTVFRGIDEMDVNMEDDDVDIGIEVDYEAAKENLAEAQKAAADNEDLTKVVELQEAERKAEKVYNFFAAQKASAEKDLAAGKLKVARLGDDPMTDAVVETDYPLETTLYTVEEHEALTELEDKRVDAADALKDAYDARDEASDVVEEKQGDARAYLDQLIALRQYEKGVADAAAEDADADDLDENDLTEDQVEANEALATAEAQRDAHDDLENRSAVVQDLVNALLVADDEIGDDDGKALVDAIDATYQTAEGAADTANAAMDAVAGLGGEDGDVAGNAAAIAALTAEDNPDTADVDETGPVTVNANNIADTNDIAVANENTLVDHDMKLMAKKAYIDAIGAEMGFDAAMDEGTGDGGMSRIDTNEAGVAANSTAITAETAARMEADTALDGRIDAEALAREAADIALDGRIDTEASAREMADTALGGRIDTEASAREMADTALGGRIDAEETARMDADTMLGGRIDTEEAARMSADVAEEAARMSADAVEEAARMEADTMLHGMIGAEETARMSADTMLDGLVASNTASISSNADNIAANMNSIGANSASIADNRNMIGELSDDLSVVRAGVAASMALAGMPAINGRGISIGVGSFDGESAFAVGFQIQGEMASFKIGLTSGGGATGASAGVGFQF